MSNYRLTGTMDNPYKAKSRDHYEWVDAEVVRTQKPMWVIATTALPVSLFRVSLDSSKKNGTSWCRI